MGIWNSGGAGAPRGRGRPDNDEAMSPEDFIREIFEEARRERVPDGHLLMEHLNDQEYSTADAVSVAFGNRATLQRLYDEGNVKPQSDAVFREALGLPPREGSAAALAAAQGAAQGADEHENRRLREKQTDAPQAQPQPVAPVPRQEPGVGPALDRMANGVTTAVGRAWDTVTGNEALHEGAAKGFGMAGKVVGYTGEKILIDHAVDAGIGATGKMLGKIPKIGSILKTGVELIDNHKKFYELSDDYKNLPKDMHDLGKDLQRIGSASKKRRMPYPQLRMGGFNDSRPCARE